MKRLALFIVFFAMSACADTNSVKLTCWILCRNNGSTPFTTGIVSNLVEGVNEIYRQVDLSFYIESISFTNDSYLADLQYSNAVQKKAICGIANNTGGLELYFVASITGTAVANPTAFHRYDGIVVGPGANARSLAHEIGHACNLRDIYNWHSGTNYIVTGSPLESRMPNDWGWYPPTITHSNVVERLLMYGFRSDYKADISYGDIHGLFYTNSWNRTTNKWDKHWNLDKAPVGFDIHGNRNPVSQ